MERLKTAMVGVGGFGAGRRRRMRKTGLFDIVACFDFNEDTLRKACEEEDATACGSFEELLEVPDTDVMVVSTGATSHAEYTIGALNAGKHVFVEKPLASTADEIQRMIAAKEETGLVVGMGHKYEPAHPQNQLVKQYIEKGKIGTVTAIEANKCHSGALAGHPDGWRFDPGKNPGGMLFQCGVHAMHTLRYLFGEIEEVSSFMRDDVVAETETPDATLTMLRFDSGLVGSLNCYHTTAYKHSLRVFGTAGNLYLETVRNKAWYQERKQNEFEAVEPVEELPEPEADHNDNLRSFAHAIRHGGTPYPSIYDGAKPVAVCLAAVESEKTGRKVAVGNLGW